MQSQVKSIKAKLQNILTTYYEIYTTPMTVPCITFIESGNGSHLKGDTIEYSNINYTVKLWTKDLSELETKSHAIDKAMRELGFKRDGTNQLINNGLICYIMNYSALNLEIYD